MKITPGPWIWENGEVQTPKGTLLVKGMAFPSGNHDLVEEAKANSIAIAALPDCLEALQDLDSYLEAIEERGAAIGEKSAMQAKRAKILAALKKAGCV